MKTARMIMMTILSTITVLFSGQVQSSMCCVSCAMRKEDEIELQEDVDRYRKQKAKEAK
jgi:hypothetical protein